MIVNKMTVREKRAKIREFYEKKYQKLLSEQYDIYCGIKAKNIGMRKTIQNKINFLVRERNLKLAELDQAKAPEVHKLYKTLFKSTK